MTTFVNQTKSSSSFINATKSSTSFTNQAISMVNSFLLLENGSYLLLETGDKLILEGSVISTSWSNQTKS